MVVQLLADGKSKQIFTLLKGKQLGYKCEAAQRYCKSVFRHKVHYKAHSPITVMFYMKNVVLLIVARYKPYKDFTPSKIRITPTLESVL